MNTTADLSTIKVLYRANDSLILYGIPYEMKTECRQQPADLARARNTDGWIYLNEQEPEIQAFLKPLGDLVPEWPNEWSRMADL